MTAHVAELNPNCAMYRPFSERHNGGTTSCAHLRILTYHTSDVRSQPLGTRARRQFDPLREPRARAIIASDRPRWKSKRDIWSVESRKREPTPAGFEFPTEDQLQAAVQTFGMLGDPTRLRILWSLLQGEQTVSRLAELVGVQQPTVSQHLAKLRMARLVRQRRQGSFVFYEVDRKHVRPLLKQALGKGDRSAPNVTARSGAKPSPKRTRLDRGAASALSGWTLNHGHAVPAASSVGFAINTPAVLASIAIGILLLAPLSRFAGLLTQWLERRSASLPPIQESDRATHGMHSLVPDPTSRYQFRLSPRSMVATIAVAGIALGAILFDISRYDPTGTALAWSPGVAVLSLGVANFLNQSRKLGRMGTELWEVTQVSAVWTNLNSDFGSADTPTTLGRVGVPSYIHAPNYGPASVGFGTSRRRTWT